LLSCCTSLNPLKMRVSRFLSRFGTKTGQKPCHAR
jgi:hypothetical protein